MSEKIKTGGPAFPSGERYLSDGNLCGKNPLHQGMTLRDHFAAKAMQTLVVEQWAPKDCARQAYEFADAMLKARGE